MTLTVRNPDIDLSLGFDRHWYGGNLAVTHVFNALSMLFPQGEKFFIDATKVVASQTDLSDNPKLAKQIKAFVSQEITHSHHHQVYNDTLEKQGFPNTIEPTIIWLNELSLRKLSPLTNLAFVSAYEHYTAILGDFLLKKPELLEPAQKELAIVWGWHCVEETEHKAVCFDLYKFAGGGWLRRVITFLNVSISFMIFFLRAYLGMLYQDGGLHPKRIYKTLSEAIPFFWGRKGFMWHLIFHSVKYLSPRFHPWNYDNSADALNWIKSNQKAFK